jgi:hypothetical protein
VTGHRLNPMIHASPCPAERTPAPTLKGTPCRDPGKMWPTGRSRSSFVAAEVSPCGQLGAYASNGAGIHDLASDLENLTAAMESSP